MVMPVYNGQIYLRQAVESILNQTFTDLELILIDDGLTDGTAEILDEYANRDPRILLDRNPRNIGIARSLNRGIAMSQGEYIARMDADDVSRADRLSRQFQFMEARPEVGVLGCRCQLIDDAGNLAPKLSRVPFEHAVIKWYLCFGCPIVHPTVMMRRDVVNQAGGYSEEVTTEDYDLWQRLSGTTRLANLSDVLLCLRKHRRNASKIQAEDVLQTGLQISQRMMSETLGHEVPMRQVRNVWCEEYDSFKDSQEVARLICKLCHASIEDSAPSKREERVIRQDAVMRLLRPFRRTHGMQAWIRLAWACRLAPFLGSKYVAGIVHQRFRRGMSGPG